MTSINIALKSQFHYGSIKTSLRRGVCFIDTPRLNSTMVRLKLKYIAKCKLLENVSIPLWFDYPDFVGTASFHFAESFEVALAT